MKKIVFTFLFSFIAFSLFAQIKVESDGDIGIGGNTSSYHKLNVTGHMKVTGGNGAAVAPVEAVSSYTVYGLHVAGPTLSGYLIYVGGSAYATSSWQSSDVQYKKNINNLDGSVILSKLLEVNGKKYEFKSANELEKIIPEISGENKTDYPIPQFPDGEQYGLIAQDLENEFPELVKLDSITNTRAINYNGMIPLLLEAIKAQNNQITTLQQIVTEHEQEILAIKEQFDPESTLKKATIDDVNPIENGGIILYQNAPNPFSQETEIKFFIAQEISSAKIYIHDLSGGEIKVYDINQRGNGSLVIQGAELNKGMYTYTLVADGAIVDTKRMILTD